MRPPDTRWSAGAIVGHFAEFYQDVAELKLAIVEGRIAALLGRELPEHPNDRDLAAAVSGRLARRLRDQAHAAKEAPDAEQRAFHLAQYVMAVLADEIFILELPWSGKSAWLSHLLEQALYQQHRAGETFFTRLDKLLSRRSRSALSLELATLFLLALQLGFQGEHRGTRGAAVLADYRVKLLRYIAARQLGADSSGHAFPQAHAYTLTDQPDRRIASLTPWLRASLLGIAAYLVVSTILWFYLIAPVTTQIQLYTRMGN